VCGDWPTPAPETKTKRAEAKPWPIFYPQTDRCHRHRIIIVIMGVFSLKGLSIEQYPFLAPPTIRITATYPGASAVAVEQSVATPIEQEVNGVDRMIYMQSSNTSDGRMLDVNFEVGVNQDMSNVLTKIAAIRKPRRACRRKSSLKGDR
jgi:multidrug efflux pump subunit AcrB